LIHSVLGASSRHLLNTGVGMYWNTSIVFRWEKSTVSMFGARSSPTQAVAGRAT